MNFTHASNCSILVMQEQVGCRQSAGEAQEAMRDNQCMKTVPTPPTPRRFFLEYKQICWACTNDNLSIWFVLCTNEMQRQLSLMTFIWTNEASANACSFIFVPTI